MSSEVMPHGEALPDADIVRVIQRFRHRCRLSEPHCKFGDLSMTEADHVSLERRSSYQLTIGLVLRSLSGIRRVVKRCLVPPASSNHDPDVLSDSDINRLEVVLRYFTRDEDLVILDEYYPPSFLYDIAIELKMKLDTLSPKLLADYHRHPLYPPNPETRRLIFDRDFLAKVLAFHNQVRRPDGTYEQVHDQRIAELAVLPRDICLSCGSRRQLYCGDCGGIRLAVAESILPPRISLPFDVLLIIHWQESLHKCTGMHAIAMTEEDQVSYVIWPRIVKGGDISPTIESLDPHRDILLFPSKDAVLAEAFQWSDDQDTSLEKPSHSQRHRLVVLEASWNHGKTMANQIIQYRQEHGFPPIPCVILTDIVGEYWRFQREGHGALSTIEAIAHTAKAAGLDHSKMNDLLCLFQAQKFRVLDRVAHGGIAPQAITVEGSGIGSWKEYTDQINEEE